MMTPPTDDEGRLAQYEVIRQIGAGRFGEVFIIKHKASQKKLCWKLVFYRGLREKEKQQLVSEVNVMRELQHPNIVRYFDRIVCKTKQCLYIVMEYCDAGDLAKQIEAAHKHHGGVDEERVALVAAQLLSALAYCHEGVGTPYYWSPELLQEGRKNYNAKSDMWAVGCILFEMCTGRSPFADAQTMQQLKDRVRKGPALPLKGFSSSINALVAALLQPNPKNRPSALQCLGYSFFRSCPSASAILPLLPRFPPPSLPLAAAAAASSGFAEVPPTATTTTPAAAALTQKNPRTGAVTPTTPTAATTAAAAFAAPASSNSSPRSSTTTTAVRTAARCSSSNKHAVPVFSAGAVLLACEGATAQSSPIAPNGGGGGGGGGLGPVVVSGGGVRQSVVARMLPELVNAAENSTSSSNDDDDEAKTPSSQQQQSLVMPHPQQRLPSFSNPTTLTTPAKSRSSSSSCCSDGTTEPTASVMVADQLNHNFCLNYYGGFFAPAPPLTAPSSAGSCDDAEARRLERILRSNHHCDSAFGTARRLTLPTTAGAAPSTASASLQAAPPLPLPLPVPVPLPVPLPLPLPTSSAASGAATAVVSSIKRLSSAAAVAAVDDNSSCAFLPHFKERNKKLEKATGAGAAASGGWDRQQQALFEHAARPTTKTAAADAAATAYRRFHATGAKNKDTSGGVSPPPPASSAAAPVRSRTTGERGEQQQQQLSVESLSLRTRFLLEKAALAAAAATAASAASAAPFSSASRAAAAVEFRATAAAAAKARVSQQTEAEVGAAASSAGLFREKACVSLGAERTVATVAAASPPLQQLQPSSSRNSLRFREAARKEDCPELGALGGAHSPLLSTPRRRGPKAGTAKPSSSSSCSQGGGTDNNKSSSRESEQDATTTPYTAATAKKEVDSLTATDRPHATSTAHCGSPPPPFLPFPAAGGGGSSASRSPPLATDSALAPPSVPSNSEAGAEAVAVADKCSVSLKEERRLQQRLSLRSNGRCGTPLKQQLAPHVQALCTDCSVPSSFSSKKSSSSSSSISSSPRALPRREAGKEQRQQRRTHADSPREALQDCFVGSDAPHLTKQQQQERSCPTADSAAAKALAETPAALAQRCALYRRCSAPVQHTASNSFASLNACEPAQTTASKRRESPDEVGRAVTSSSAAVQVKEYSPAATDSLPHTATRGKKAAHATRKSATHKAAPALAADGAGAPFVSSSSVKRGALTSGSTRSCSSTQHSSNRLHTSHSSSSSGSPALASLCAANSSPQSTWLSPPTATKFPQKLQDSQEFQQQLINEHQQAPTAPTTTTTRQKQTLPDFQNQQQLPLQQLQQQQLPLQRLPLQQLPLQQLPLQPQQPDMYPRISAPEVDAFSTEREIEQRRRRQQQHRQSYSWQRGYYPEEGETEHEQLRQHQLLSAEFLDKNPSHYTTDAESAVERGSSTTSRTSRGQVDSLDPPPPASHSNKSPSALRRPVWSLLNSGRLTTTATSAQNCSNNAHCTFASSATTTTPTTTPPTIERAGVFSADRTTTGAAEAKSGTTRSRASLETQQLLQVLQQQEEEQKQQQAKSRSSRSSVLCCCDGAKEEDKTQKKVKSATTVRPALPTLLSPRFFCSGSITPTAQTAPLSSLLTSPEMPPRSDSNNSCVSSGDPLSNHISSNDSSHSIGSPTSHSHGSRSRRAATTPTATAWQRAEAHQLTKSEKARFFAEEEAPAPLSARESAAAAGGLCRESDSRSSFSSARKLQHMQQQSLAAGAAVLSSILDMQETCGQLQVQQQQHHPANVKAAATGGRFQTDSQHTSDWCSSAVSGKASSKTAAATAGLTATPTAASARSAPPVVEPDCEQQRNATPPTHGKRPFSIQLLRPQRQPNWTYSQTTSDSASRTSIEQKHTHTSKTINDGGKSDKDEDSVIISSGNKSSSSSGSSNSTLPTAGEKESYAVLQQQQQLSPNTATCGLLPPLSFVPAVFERAGTAATATATASAPEHHLSAEYNRLSSQAGRSTSSTVAKQQFRQSDQSIPAVAISAAANGAPNNARSSTPRDFIKRTPRYSAPCTGSCDSWAVVVEDQALHHFLQQQQLQPVQQLQQPHLQPLLQQHVSQTYPSTGIRAAHSSLREDVNSSSSSSSGTRNAAIYESSAATSPMGGARSAQATMDTYSFQSGTNNSSSSGSSSSSSSSSARSRCSAPAENSNASSINWGSSVSVAPPLRDAAAAVSCRSMQQQEQQAWLLPPNLYVGCGSYSKSSLPATKPVTDSPFAVSAGKTPATAYERYSSSNNRLSAVSGVAVGSADAEGESTSDNGRSSSSTNVWKELARETHTEGLAEDCLEMGTKVGV